MVITREDVRRQITFQFEDKTSMKTNKNSGAPPKSVNGTDHGQRSNVSSNLRHRSKNTEKIRLDRLTSSEFDSLIGEGTSSSVIEEKKKAHQQKKLQEKLKMENLSALNAKVAQQGTVHEQESNNDSQTLSGERDKVQDDTLAAVGDPSLDPESGIVPEASALAPAPSQEESVPTPIPSADGIKNQRENLLTVLSNSGTQTEPVVVGCWCRRCQALSDGLNLILKAAGSSECQFLKTPQQDSSRGTRDPLAPIANILDTSVNQSNSETPLYSGSTIMLSPTDKSLLKDLNAHNDEPRDFLNVIMEGLYTVEQMGNMSAMGRTAGSTKMDPTIFKQIYAYLRHKYKSVMDVNITKSYLVTLVNAKCYAMRRQCWDKNRRNEDSSQRKNGDGSSTSLLVRERLKKKTRDPNKPPKPRKRKSDDAANLNTDVSVANGRDKKKRKHDKEDKMRKGDCGMNERDNREERSERSKMRGRSSRNDLRIREERNGRSKTGGRSRNDNEMGEERSDRSKTGESSRNNNDMREERSERHKIERSRNDNDKIEERHERSKTEHPKPKQQRFFQSDSSKHLHRLTKSPMKANGNGSLKLLNRSPKKGNFSLKIPTKSPKKANGNDSLKQTIMSLKETSGSFSVESQCTGEDVITLPPQFGGKRPKPIGELLAMTYRSNGDEDSPRLKPPDEESSSEVEEYYSSEFDENCSEQSVMLNNSSPYGNYVSDSHSSIDTDS